MLRNDGQQCVRERPESPRRNLLCLWIVCAINELGNQIKRAEKWKRVAVAQKKCEQARAAYRKGGLLSPDSLHALDEEWTKADLEFAEAILALGDEWTEAIR